MAFPDVEWFKAAPFGKAFQTVDAGAYAWALAVAESELSELQCFCPDLYPFALQVKIALLLTGMGCGATSGQPAVVPSGGKVAYVTGDKVGDVERRFTLADAEEQIKNSSAANALSGMIARCKAPFSVGATLVQSVRTGFGSCCGHLGLDNGALHDMGVVDLVQAFADKSDG